MSSNFRLGLGLGDDFKRIKMEEGHKRNKSLKKLCLLLMLLKTTKES